MNEADNQTGQQQYECDEQTWTKPDSVSMTSEVEMTTSLSFFECNAASVSQDPSIGFSLELAMWIPILVINLTEPPISCALAKADMATSVYPEITYTLIVSSTANNSTTFLSHRLEADLCI